MNILMVTNTYLPHVGGVAQSVHRFTEEDRARGHRVVVAAPKFDDLDADETDVYRVPAIQNFNGSDFSFSFPTLLSKVRDDLDFHPDIVHSHHPYLMGDAALRLSARQDVPLVFTHHTMYEQYTHYVPGDSTALRRFVVDLSTRYANLCQAVVAPSESVRDILVRRGVESPIHVIPTGLDLDRFADGLGAWWRMRYRIPEEGYVIGHLGRLAPEKNLGFLAEAVADYMEKNESAYFMVVGSGPSRDEVAAHFRERGLEKRLFFTGPLSGQDLVDAYHAMDVFAFASQSETQGMVIAEAMACGVPVVAVDAAGVREVVRDGENGRMIPEEDREAFAEALGWVRERGGRRSAALAKGVKETAQAFSASVRAEQALKLYEAILAEANSPDIEQEDTWDRILGSVEREWELWSNRVAAAAGAFTKEKAE